MREIKFRGMDINGEWHVGLLAIIDTPQKECGYFISNRAGMAYAYKIRPETVCQYTGLKDKNGKEIYEGDILKYTAGVNDEIRQAEVVYSYHFCGFACRPLNKHDMPIGLINNKSEVVGNIYENPELLNKN